MGLNRLRDEDEIRHAAEALQMDADKARKAISVFRKEAFRIWPDAVIAEDPANPRL